jgi:hypothetical protein
LLESIVKVGRKSGKHEMQGGFDSWCTVFVNYNYYYFDFDFRKHQKLK